MLCRCCRAVDREALARANLRIEALLDEKAEQAYAIELLEQQLELMREEVGGPEGWGLVTLLHVGVRSVTSSKLAGCVASTRMLHPDPLIWRGRKQVLVSSRTSAGMGPWR
jgi:hypothetical protein